MYLISPLLVAQLNLHVFTISASLLLDNLLSFLTTKEHTDCKAAYLHVLSTNHTAIHFYERRNFCAHSYLPYYYSINGKPRDGYSYVRYINGGRPPWSLLYPFIVEMFDEFTHSYHLSHNKQEGILTLLHSERPKLYAILVFLSAVGLNV